MAQHSNVVESRGTDRIFIQVKADMYLSIVQQPLYYLVGKTESFLTASMCVVFFKKDEGKVEDDQPGFLIFLFGQNLVNLLPLVLKLMMDWFPNKDSKGHLRILDTVDEDRTIIAI